MKKVSRRKSTKRAMLIIIALLLTAHLISNTAFTTANGKKKVNHTLIWTNDAL